MESNAGGEQENHIKWITEPLLVMRVIRTRRINGTTIVARLNFAGDFRAVGIASVEQQFSGSEPARIEIGKIAARSFMQSPLGNLMRN